MNIEEIALEDSERSRLEKLGDKDWYLARSDSAVVFRAIAMSLPLLSAEANMMRFASVACKLSRKVDVWVYFHAWERFPSEKPISVAAAGFLSANASQDLLAELQTAFDVNVTNGKQKFLVLDDLYQILGRGYLADKFRVDMTRKIGQAKAEAVTAGAQSRAFKVISSPKQ